MKRYIKPECDIIEISVEGFLASSPGTDVEDVTLDGDNNNIWGAAWGAPRRERSGSLWDDDEE